MDSIQQLASVFGTNVFIFVLVLVWSIIWKGIALWKSARSGSKVWFVVLLVINLVGILEILYIFIFSKLGKEENQDA